MHINEKNEEAGVNTRSEAMGERRPVAVQPSAQIGGADTFRIGTKDDIREAGAGEGSGKSGPHDTLRDGT